MTARVWIAVGALVALLATACGGASTSGDSADAAGTAAGDNADVTGDDAADTDNTTDNGTTADNGAADATADDGTENGADDDAADDGAGDDAATGAAGDAAEQEPASPPRESTPIPVISIAEIPDLIAEWGTGAGDPLDIARRLIGFPLEIPVPGGSTPYSVRVDLDGRDTTADWRWDWSYGAAAGEPIGHVDADLPEGGEGTIEGRLHFDAAFESFGWHNSAQVISDPSNGGGGPRSVNWAYQKDDPVFRLGEIDADALGARAWVDEDIDFRPGDDIAGFQVDISLRAQPNFIPVPLLEALFREVPVAPGARLVELDFASFDRTADSTFAAEGLRYLELTYICELLPNSEMAAREVYSNGLTGTAYQMGRESFFDEGVIETADAEVDGNGVWRQAVIVMHRYPGEISVWVEDDGTVMSRVDVTLEPNREELQPPPA